MQAPLVFKSQPRAWSSAAGQKATWDLSSSPFPAKGPNGGRIVVDRISAHAPFNLTVATAVINGPDTYRLFRTLTLRQKDGISRYLELPGDCLRNMLYELVGGDVTKDHADAAVATANYTATALVPLKKRFAHEDEDYSMAVDLWEVFEIGMAVATDLQLNGNTVTINSGNYYFIAECHEEMDLVLHCVDEIRAIDMPAAGTTEADIPTNGRLQDMVVMVRGQNGGQTLANLTEAWLSLPLFVAPQMLVTPDLQERYARERFAVTGLNGTQGSALRSDPYVTSTIRACAVLLCTGTKCFEQPELANVHIKFTLGGALPAAATVIIRTVKARPASTEAQIATKYGMRGQFRIKTQSNSQRTPAAWPKELHPYLPKKIVA